MDEKPVTMKVRAVIVDGRVKEYELGMPHEVTRAIVRHAAGISRQ